MRIRIASPIIESIQTGNKSTAQQWAGILRSLGHEVTVADGMTSCCADVLVALHGVKGHAPIMRFRTECPQGRVILALTGTDIYPQTNDVTLESMAQADVLIVLQEKAIRQIPSRFESRVRVVIQSAVPSNIDAFGASKDPFVICVPGHLRKVKDPMRAAEAARQLPPESKIRIDHAGAILDGKFRAIVEQELRENPRYKYCGELTEEKLRALMRQSQATVLASHAEGGARVIGESIAEGTAVIATKIDGVTGLIGDDYPGLFEVGDTETLTQLLWRLETDVAFRTLLNDETARLAHRFHPSLEKEAWNKLIGELTNK